MRRVYKYSLELLKEDDQTIKVPHGKILHANIQHDNFCLWFLFQEREEPIEEDNMVERTFRLFTTGAEVPVNYTHIASGQMTLRTEDNYFVVHLFEKN